MYHVAMLCPTSSRKIENYIFFIMTIKHKMFHIHNPNHKFYLNLFNMYIATNNPAYRTPNNPVYDEKKYGSRNQFHVNCHINGEYFRSLSNNHYYRIVDKNADPKNFHYFWPSDDIRGRTVDPKREKLLRLEIVKNKKYWIEQSQGIDIGLDQDPDVVVVDTPIDDLCIPVFVPVPEY